jgi:hypothetical protein
VGGDRKAGGRTHLDLFLRIQSLVIIITGNGISRQFGRSTWLFALLNWWALLAVGLWMGFFKGGEWRLGTLRKRDEVREMAVEEKASLCQ